jgi:hypothetical protein
MSQTVDLTAGKTIPGHPAYVVFKDGRVYSLKKGKGAFLSEIRRPSPVWWRVRISGVEVQTRGLVLGLFGDMTAFEKRARQWAEENLPNQEENWDEDWLEDLQ